MDAESARVAVQYDLVSTMSPFMDLHMMFPLINFLEEQSLYAQQDLLKTKIDLLRPTNMVDYTIDLVKELEGEGSSQLEQLAAQRQEVLDSSAGILEACQPLLTLVEDQELLAKLMDEDKFNLEYLGAPDDPNLEPVTQDVLTAFYHFGKWQYECGNYAATADYMYYFRMLEPNSDLSVKALWGKLASEILAQKWETAVEDLNELKGIIDERDEATNKSANHHLEQLQLRSWLLHWSLFIFWNHPDGRSLIIEFFFAQKYLNAIQTNCPWLLRYLTTAVITNKAQRRKVLKQLVRVIQQEQYTYRDPITEFLECLYVNFDFEGAQDKLAECEKVLASDYFLTFCQEDFLENARLFIFETYCRIHTKIDVSMLSTKLHMAPDEAERWIVDLIRNAKLDAKIDSEQHHVIMGQHHPAIYQQVIDRTKDLTFRTYKLANDVLYLKREGVIA